MKASWTKQIFRFRFDAGTSKGILREKAAWFLQLEENGKVGIGECSTVPGISPDSSVNYDYKLSDWTIRLSENQLIASEELIKYPAFSFALETALLDLSTGGRKILFDTPFTRGETGIPINGLVWMGSRDFMEQQIRAKLEAGLRCIKLKIGSLDFEIELEILKNIRKQFSASELELRVDANGAFAVKDALTRLQRLSNFHIHSIEQPIQAGQWEAMAHLCQSSPIPIALDEELSPIISIQQKRQLIDVVRPQYLILKPSMLGGFAKSEEWMVLASEFGVGWWVTSALESNIGLNAIAQWTSSMNISMRQGLGTGQLYENNIASPLEIVGENLFYFSNKGWG